MAMNVIYTGESMPTAVTKSIFLAGPTPRSKDVQSWRPEALRILEAKGYDGVVFVPEDRDGSPRIDYDSQVSWEHDGLNMADCILFWVPRDLATMPAFTTNVEFGLWAKSGKVVFGGPLVFIDGKMVDIPGNPYLRYVTSKEYIPNADTLEATIELALQFIGEGAARLGGECQVPLHIWKTPAFQRWYTDLVIAKNRLDGAQVEWCCRVGHKRQAIYAWALHVNVYVRDENRNKTNERVLARPDIATVIMYQPSPFLYQSKVVLVREFRSPARTADGFIHELPGGSSPNPHLWPLDIAAEEVFEETGLRVSQFRLRNEGSRQLAGTFSSHHAHVFSVALTDEEVQWFEGQAGIPHGLQDGSSGELTYIEVKTLEQIIRESLVDWSTVGMIMKTMARI